MSGGIIDPTTQDWQPHPRFPDAFLKPLVGPTANPGLNINLVRLLPGATIPPHVHETSTETFIILAGRARCKIGEVDYEMAAGMCGYALPGVTHGVSNAGDTPMEALSIFNPPLS